MLNRRIFSAFITVASVTAVAYLVVENKSLIFGRKNTLGGSKIKIGFSVKCALLNFNVISIDDLKGVVKRKVAFDQVLLGRVFVSECELSALEV